MADGDWGNAADLFNDIYISDPTDNRRRFKLISEAYVEKAFCAKCGRYRPRNRGHGAASQSTPIKEKKAALLCSVPYDLRARMLVHQDKLKER